MAPANSSCSQISRDPSLRGAGILPARTILSKWPGLKPVNSAATTRFMPNGHGQEPSCRTCHEAPQELREFGKPIASQPAESGLSFWFIRSPASNFEKKKIFRGRCKGVQLSAS